MDNPECPFCGGPGVFLGNLGKIAHFRCRNCGINFGTDADDVPTPPEDTEEEFEPCN